MRNYSEETPEEKPTITPWEDEVCKVVLDEWDRGRQYVSDLDDLYDDLYAMLRGERPEKNYDWESNIVINKVFQVVWTAIPYITQKIFGSNPIIGISSSDKEGAWAREEILEFWNTMQPSKNHTPYFLIVVMWTLRALLNGVGFLKKSYHQKLKTESFEEQIVVPTEIGDDGKPTQVEPHTIKRKKTFPVEDWPVNRIVNNKDIVVTLKLTGPGTVTETIPANSRKTFNLSDITDPGEVGLTVESSDKIMVEKAMYFDNRSGGSDTIGLPK